MLILKQAIVKDWDPSLRSNLLPSQTNNSNEILHSPASVDYRALIFSSRLKFPKTFHPKTFWYQDTQRKSDFWSWSFSFQARFGKTAKDLNSAEGGMGPASTVTRAEWTEASSSPFAALINGPSRPFQTCLCEKRKPNHYWVKPQGLEVITNKARNQCWVSS